MKKNIFITLFSLILSISLTAQVFNPVSWKVSTERNSENLYTLIFTADIEEGWHLYASELSSDEGPVPTGIFWAEGSPERVGGIIEKDFITKQDPMFDMEVSYYEHKAVLKQQIKVSSFPIKISGDIEFMVCNDERCLPPELEEFEITLSGKEVFTATTTAEINTDVVTEEVITVNHEDNTEEIFDPVAWEFSTEKKENGYLFTAKANIEEGWHLYAMGEGDLDGPIPTSFVFEHTGNINAANAVKQPNPIRKYDNNFLMEVDFFENNAVFTQQFSADETDSFKGFVSFMVCNDERCLPPTDVEFNIPVKTGIPVTAEVVANEKAAQKLTQLKLSGLDIDNPLSNCKSEGEIVQGKKSMWTIFALGFIGGLIALLTPCVFPMIPLTVSFFTKKGDSGQSKGMGQSILYGFCIFFIYILLSLPFHLMDSVDPEILNTISTNVYLNVSFFVIFVVFAFSFFGFYEITLPTSFTNKVDSASNIGGIVGTFFMALTLALVSFSCTGPILGSLLAGALTADGGAMQLSVGMGSFGLALALPFGLFAAFPSMLNKLPKSGGWMNTVKGVLGFVELALAIKFISNADLVQHWGILPREIFFGLWILIATLLALYLFGILRLKHDYGKPVISKARFSFGVIVSLFVLYLLPGLTSNPEWANRKMLSGFPPPLFYSVYEQESHCPLNLPCYKNYEEGMAAAKAQGKAVMLDFTGWACVNCRKMEENVWVEPAVYEQLQNDVIVISLYVDDREKLPEDEQFEYVNELGKKKKIRTLGNKWSTFQTENFRNNSQPFYALLTPDGELISNPVGYTPNADDFAKFLECGIANFNGLEQPEISGK
jgi:thiol:disulfide interchange protein